MTTWSIALGGPIPRVPVEDVADSLMETLEANQPSVSLSRDRLEVRLTVAGESLHVAAGLALELLREASVGFVDWAPDELEALATSRLDVRNNQSGPSLAGVGELSHRLGVTRQRASALARQSSFPTPLARLKSGPVWLSSSIDSFVTEWERRPGRPKRSVAKARS